MKDCTNCPTRSFDAMFTWVIRFMQNKLAAKPMVPCPHAKVTDIKEDDASGTGLVHGVAQQRTRIRPRGSFTTADRKLS
jgi:hypothetical protein